MIQQAIALRRPGDLLRAEAPLLGQGRGRHRRRAGRRARRWTRPGSLAEGTDVTLLGLRADGADLRRGRGGRRARTAASVEVIDLRSLSPLDTETILASVRRTGRCVVVHEAPVTGGLGAEIAARVTEECFYQLEAPVLRVGGFATPYPPSRLEDHYLPDLDRVLDAVDRTLRLLRGAGVTELQAVQAPRRRRGPDRGRDRHVARASPATWSPSTRSSWRSRRPRPSSSCPARSPGVVAELLVAEGATVDVGTPIIAVDTTSARRRAPAVHRQDRSRTRRGPRSRRAGRRAAPRRWPTDRVPAAATAPPRRRHGAGSRPPGAAAGAAGRPGRLRRRSSAPTTRRPRKEARRGARAGGPAAAPATGSPRPAAAAAAAPDRPAGSRCWPSRRSASWPGTSASTWPRDRHRPGRHRSPATTCRPPRTPPLAAAADRPGDRPPRPGVTREERIPVRGVRKHTAAAMVGQRVHRAARDRVPADRRHRDDGRGRAAAGRCRSSPGCGSRRCCWWPRRCSSRWPAPDDQLALGRGQPRRSWSSTTSTWASPRPPRAA